MITATRDKKMIELMTKVRLIDFICIILSYYYCYRLYYLHIVVPSMQNGQNLAEVARKNANKI